MADLFKVGDVNKSKDISTSKVKKSTSGSDFSSYLNETFKSGDAPVSGASNISVADAIFATQMVGGLEEKEIRKKLVKRGLSLLDKLEDIRDAILLGHVSKDKLIDISRFVKERNVDTTDDKLKAIMSELELRVEVELAKLMK